MSGSGNTTVPASADEPQYAVPRGRVVPALVDVWNASEPHRIGEVALLDFSAYPELLLGREDREGPPDPRLLHFVRQRPGRSTDCGPLQGRSVSRRQLLFRQGAGGVDVQSVGRTKFLINGHVMTPGAWHRVQLGDVLQLAGHSNFLFGMRPLVLPAPIEDASATPPEHDFGEPDGDGIVGESPAAWDVRTQLVAAVRTGGHVFLHGDSGTGKELAARAIHRHGMSGRTGPFVAFNASTLVSTLAELQLFGNLANYPNPGTPARPGLFGEADGGTLFLDELAEPPRETQAKLLRALHRNGEYSRLGEGIARKVNAVVVAATNRPVVGVEKELLKRFRSFVEIPPLSARMEDIPLLAQNLVLTEYRERPPLAARFVTEGTDGRPCVRMTGAFVLAMLRSSYDGNVRDLHNLLLRSMTESPGDALEQPSDMRPWRVRPSLPPPAPVEEPARNADDTDRNPALDDSDDDEDLLGPSRNAILEALEKRGWNQSRAADALGISRFKLARLMTKRGIKRPG